MLMGDEYVVPVGNVGAVEVEYLTTRGGRQRAVVLTEVHHPVAQPLVGIVDDWPSDRAVVARRVCCEHRVQPVMGCQTMLLDNSHNITTGLLHPPSAQCRYALAPRAVDDTHPGELLAD